MRLTRSAWVSLAGAGAAAVAVSMTLGLDGDDLAMSTASGGGGSASGGSYSLRSSIGQPEAGHLASGSYVLEAGVLGAAQYGAVTTTTATATASATPSTTPGAHKRYAPFIAKDGVP